MRNALEAIPSVLQELPPGDCHERIVGVVFEVSRLRELLAWVCAAGAGEGRNMDLLGGPAGQFTVAGDNEPKERSQQQQSLVARPPSHLRNGSDTLAQQFMSRAQVTASTETAACYAAPALVDTDERNPTAPPDKEKIIPTGLVARLSKMSGQFSRLGMAGTSPGAMGLGDRKLPATISPPPQPENPPDEAWPAGTANRRLSLQSIESHPIHQGDLGSARSNSDRSVMGDGNVEIEQFAKCLQNPALLLHLNKRLELPGRSLLPNLGERCVTIYDLEPTSVVCYFLSTRLVLAIDHPAMGIGCYISTTRAPLQFQNMYPNPQD